MYRYTTIVNVIEKYIRLCESNRIEMVLRVTTHLENMEKSANWIVVREKSGKMEKVRESYNHHLAAA